MAQSVRDSLRGCLEIAIFLPRGVEKFENSRRAFFISLLVPLVMIVFHLPIAAVDPELSQLTFINMFVVLAYRIVVGTAFFLVGTWAACWPIERIDHFYRFGNAYNWLSVVGYVLLLPYAMLIATGIFTQEQVGDYLLFIVGFFCALTAFTARHALKTNWLIAVGIGFFALYAEVMAANMLGQSVTVPDAVVTEPVSAEPVAP